MKVKMKEIVRNPDVYLIFVFSTIIYLAWFYRSSLIDDAFISYRYAENFVNGHGLVFNIGDKVEGYTNFLWVILLSFFMKIGINIIIASQVLGLMFNLGTVFLVYKFPVVVSGKKSIFNLIAPLLLTANIAFTMWSVHGLETNMFTFLIFLSFYVYIWEISKNIKVPLSSIILGFAALTRPEGVLFFLIMLLHRLVKHYRKEGWIKTTLFWILGFSMIYLPYFVWRFNYYGYLFPNTFYVKVGSGYNHYIRGMRYTLNFIRQSRWIIVVLPVMLLWKKYRKDWLIIFSVTTIIYLLYVVYAGGDYFPAFRFFMPILPFIYIGFQEGMKHLSDYFTGRVNKQCKYYFFPITLIVLFITFTGAKNETNREFMIGNIFTRNMTFAGQWLRINARRDATIALNPVGAVPYYSKLRVVDMLGITDSKIAHSKNVLSGSRAPAGHEKGDGKYVLSKRPDYIFLRNVWIGTTKIEESNVLKYKSEVEIWQEPKFHELYKPVNIKIPNGYFGFYQLKDEVR